MLDQTRQEHKQRGESFTPEHQRVCHMANTTFDDCIKKGEHGDQNCCIHKKVDRDLDEPRRDKRSQENAAKNVKPGPKTMHWTQHCPVTSLPTRPSPRNAACQGPGHHHDLNRPCKGLHAQGRLQKSLGSPRVKLLGDRRLFLSSEETIPCLSNIGRGRREGTVYAIENRRTVALYYVALH